MNNEAYAAFNLYTKGWLQPPAWYTRVIFFFFFFFYFFYNFAEYFSLERPTSQAITKAFQKTKQNKNKQTNKQTNKIKIVQHQNNTNTAMTKEADKQTKINK